MKKKVMIGMSGGVDSSAAAGLLLEQGYDVVGATFRLWKPEDELFDMEGTCCSLDDINDAREVCNKLGIPHYVLNMKEEFKESVVDNFASEYQAGRTPSPCVECNRKIKFDLFYQKAMAMGFNAIATGHYARIEQNDKGFFQLKTAVYLQKDQSYFLYPIKYGHLKDILFPLGGFTKPEVREIAQRFGFKSVAQKSDSQEICFVDSQGYGAFLERYTEKIPPKGNYIDSKGNVIGQHKGIWYYTVGQRKGLGVTFGKPMYVADIDSRNNTVTLAENHELFSKSMALSNLNYLIPTPPSEPIEVMAKIRNRAPYAKATLFPQASDNASVVFEEPQRAVTKGQSAVLYDKDVIVGGGVIKDYKQ